MNNQINWQRLQVAMNNFKINRLMSFTDITNKLNVALHDADPKGKNYAKAQQISKWINDLNHKTDFVLDTKHNQQLFSQIKKAMNPLVGYAKVNDPTTEKLNSLFKQAAAKQPIAMKQFNHRAHHWDHMSAQQAMLKVMGQEIKHENK